MPTVYPLTQRVDVVTLFQRPSCWIGQKEYMKQLLILVLVMLGTVGQVVAAPYVGESVIFKEDSTHSYMAVVVDVVDSDEADLMLYGHDTLWFAQTVTYTTGGTPVVYLEDITRGSGDGQWLENDAVYVGTRITGQTSPSLTLNGAGVQLDATRDADLTMSVTVALPLSLVAGAAGTIHLFCDASANPTTEVVTLTRGNTGGLATTDTSTLLLRHRVRAADYCKVTTTQDVGAPTFAIVRQLRQVMD